MSLPRNGSHALDEVAKLDPKFIIPGHGRTSTEAKQAIAFTRDYIQYLRDTMAAAVQNWTDFDVAYDQADWSKYQEMPAFGEQQPRQRLPDLSGTGAIPVQS